MLIERALKTDYEHTVYDDFKIIGKLVNRKYEMSLKCKDVEFKWNHYSMTGFLSEQFIRASFKSLTFGCPEVYAHLNHILQTHKEGQEETSTLIANLYSWQNNEKIEEFEHYTAEKFSFPDSYPNFYSFVSDFGQLTGDLINLFCLVRTE